MFWLNISNNFERVFYYGEKFWGYNTHHKLRQQIFCEFVYMHFVYSHGLS